MYEVGSLIVVIIIGSYLAYKKWYHAKKPSLYDRLGGVYAISKVVDHFSDALINNVVVGKASSNVFLRDWSQNHLDRLPGLKFMRTLWLCSIAGGPFVYTPTKSGKCPFSLENAHKDLQISPEEFDAVANELSNTLDYFKIPSPEKQEVLDVFSAHKNEVINGYNVNKNLPTTPIIC